MRGVADRRADIAADLERRHAGGNRHGRAAGGAAGGARLVPGVGGGAVDLVEALPFDKPLRDVGLAEDDGTGGAKPRDGVGVCFGDVVLERRNAPGRGRPFEVEALFHRHRHPVEGSARLALRRLGVAGLRLLHGAVTVLPDDRVERGVHAVDAREAFLELFDGAGLAGGDGLGGLDSGQHQAARRRSTSRAMIEAPTGSTSGSSTKPGLCSGRVPA